MNTNLNALEQSIRSGEFKDRYLIYVRKSTDDEDIQKNSLKFQKQETIQFAEGQQLAIADVTLPGFITAGIISEKHSAFKVDDEFEITKSGQMVVRIERPKFRQLLRYLSQGSFKGVVIYCWDRSCRNDSDEVAIKRLIGDGIDIRFVTTTYEASSSGALHMDVDGMFAKHHSRLTSEKVTAVTRQLRAKGICTYQAPVGYLNIGRSDHKPFDPERAEMVKGLFERMATGTWTLSALERWARDVGLTMPPARRRRTHSEMLADEDDDVIVLPKVARQLKVSNIHKVLTNRFYIGLVKGPEPGEWVKSQSHEALIKPKTFEQVQHCLSGRRVSTHYETTLDLPYRKLLRCGRCNRVYTPYTQKGHTYLGARCLRGCPNQRRNLNVTQLEAEIAPIINRLRFTDAEIKTLENQLQDDITQLSTERKDVTEELDRRKKRIRADLTYLRENRLQLVKSGVYTMETYVAEEEKLNAELRALQSKEQISDAAMQETVVEIVKCSELLKTVAEHYELANSAEKEKFARILFSELRLSETGLIPSLTPGMQPFERRLCAIGDPTTRISELSAFCADVKAVSEHLADLCSELSRL